ncbi:MAG: hypothetical protein NTY53_01230, partial [Kiritimatiellaeota bacterium]|nr:hypothetical protein [Kiritimatiellota bacterium]
MTDPKTSPTPDKDFQGLEKGGDAASKAWNTDAPESEKSTRQSRRLKFAITLNTGVALVLAAALFGMLNYWSFRHYQRHDFSTTKL